MKEIRYEKLTLAHAEDALEFSFDLEDALVVLACDKDAEAVYVPDEVDGIPVTTVGEHAFEGCTALRAVTLPKSVHTVLASAFRGCTALKEVSCAPDTYFGVCAFSECTALSEMTPITCASEGLFEGCTALTTLPLAEGVRAVEGEAFAGLRDLPFAAVLRWGSSIFPPPPRGSCARRTRTATFRLTFRMQKRTHSASAGRTLTTACSATTARTGTATNEKKALA